MNFVNKLEAQLSELEKKERKRRKKKVVLKFGLDLKQREFKEPTKLA